MKNSLVQESLSVVRNI